MARPGGPPSTRFRAGPIGALLVVGLVVGIFLSAAVGSEWIPFAAVLAILARELGLGGWVAPCAGLAVAPGQCTVWTEIVWDARMPSILVAVFAGAALAISGGTLQGVFRNPLADPYLLGISSGAAVGAAVLLTFQLAVADQATLLPVFAFAGALVPGLVIYAAASGPRRAPESLVLTGVALSALFSAVLATFLFYNPAAGLQLSFWLLGNLQAETWTNAAIVAGVVVAGGTLIALSGRELNVLQLGPAIAESVGVEAARHTRRLILLCTVVTATSVAFTGVIGFVGLVSPHVVRLLVGPDYRKVLPIGAVFGGVFLLIAWDLALRILPPLALPVGIPTSFVGVPFFLYLLYRRRPAGP
ncbi:MAG TPA: iron ABC transporter permease [Thermoplasmata archaeon]|nr:iron ABC transporter permease [Thermoplasmata archaeon]